MEKNKKRDDMLAAGRKKYQQFRKKKGSSSSGKSSQETSKSEHDKDANMPPRNLSPSEPPLAAKLEVETPINEEKDSIDLSASNSVENSLPLDANLSESDSSIPSETSISRDVELVPVEAEVAQDSSPETSGITVVVEGGPTCEAEVSRVDSSASPATLEEVNRDEGNESLPAQEFVSDVSSIQGAMQEADGSSPAQYEGSAENGHQYLQDTESLEVGLVRLEQEESGETLAGASHDREVAEESTHSHVDGVSLQAEATHREEETLEMVASPETTNEVEGTPGVNPTEKSELQSENVGVDVSCKENLEQSSLSHDLVSESGHGLKTDIELEGTVDDVYKQQCLPQEAFTVVDKCQERPFEQKREVLSGGRTISPHGDIGSVDLYQLAEVLRGLDDEDLRFVLKFRPSTSKAELMDMCIIPENGIADSMDRLKEQLYLSNVANDFLSLELAEQSELQMEFDRRDHRLLNEISNLRSLLEQTQDSNKILSKELGLCRSELQVVSAGKEELETQFLSARAEVEEISSRAYELQTKLEGSHEELTNLSVQLGNCKDLLEALQMENANLNGHLISVTDERKKLKEGKEYLVHENEKLSAQLVEHQALFATEYAKHVQLEVDLKEAMMHVEQLTEENIFLSSNLDIHKTKVKEIENGNLQLLSQAEDVRDQLEGSDVPDMVPSNVISNEYSHRSMERREGEVVSDLVGESMTLSLTEGPIIQQIEREDVDNSVGLVALETHFEEAEKILQKLEKEIEGMQSHSASLSRSSAKVPAPGISKLIQAFESKVHHDDNVSEELPLVEEEPPMGDSYKLAKEQTSLLRALFSELDRSAKKANELFREEREGKKIANLALSELENLFVASKRYSSNIEAKNNELVNKLSEYQSRIDELQSQLHIIEQSSDKMRDLILNQVENLQTEVGDKTDTLEKEWNSTIATISDMVEKLDTSISRQLTSTSSTSPCDTSNVGSRVAASVDAASKVIEDLHKKLEAAHAEHEAIRSSYVGLNEKFSDLHVRNGLAVGILHTIYGDLKKLVIDSSEDGIVDAVDVRDETTLDLLQHNNYGNLIERLGKLLGKRLQLKSAMNELASANSELESAKNELELELINRAQDIEELNKKCLDSKIILKLVEDVVTVVQVQDIEMDPNVSPVSLLESLIAFLIQKYTEASEQVSSSREEFESKVMELSELQGKMHQLSSLNLEHVDEINILKEHLKKMDEDLEAARAELQTKGAELEQSEHRVSSIREKLSIAVAKGKGLIVQRDNLKQSLSEMSTELERCSMELQLKETRLYEVETKLKSYSEAGERVEALESELSYIRNSATALRESFLVKDSALQRIEEILEDLELPEHFHPRDIVEKIEWLARSVAGNSLPVTDWDQKSSVGGSYSDAGFVVMDNWKEDVQPSSNSAIDELRRNYEELQSKFYGLAEQNEMLEQSLMERNNLVQRWEEVLDRIDMPVQLRSVEPEDRIEWLGNALSEAQHDRDSLHQKIENFEAYCGSLTAALEESQRKVSDLEAALLGVTRERELLSVDLESLTREHEKVSEKAIQYELEKDKLLNEVTDLHKKLVDSDRLENKEINHHIEDEMNRFQVLISEALQDDSPDPEDAACGSSNSERLEGSLRKLIDNYMSLSPKKHVLKDTEKEHVTEDAVFDDQRFEDALNSKEKEIVLLKEELEEALCNLAHEKEERDKILEKHQSMVVEFEALGTKNDDLQGRLDQEEQKLATTREKLNVAVRKGKGLVQQRDSMKQNIEELNTEVERLKSELSQRENALIQYEQKIRDLSMYPERVEALERESLFLKNCLAETEHNLLDSRQTLSRLFDVVNAIDVGDGFNITDPVYKMEGIGKLCYDLQAAIGSSEQESKKSKRAAELLAAELNEVQERADNLQEELAQAEAAFVELARERDLVDTARVEALSRLEKFNTVRSEERKNELAEIMKLKSGIDQLRKGCFGFTDMLTNFFSMDSELLHNVDAGMQALLKQKDGTNVIHHHLFSAPSCMLSSNSVNEVKIPATGTWEGHLDASVVIEMFGIVGHGLQDCIREIDDLREKLYKHSISSDQQANSLFKFMETVHREIALQKDSFESMRRDIAHLELMAREKDTDIIAMRKKFILLYEACNNSILAIENHNSQMAGNGSTSGVRVLGKMGVDLKLPTSNDGQESVGGNAPFTEECIRTMADTLLLSVKDLASFQLEKLESSQKELKATILNLQKELQEKDMQGNRICAELVSQIKEAEGIAKNYSIDFESAKTQVNDLEKRMETMEKERIALELRIKELQDGEASSTELNEMIRSLTDVLTAKEQEIEALMQALDEEESQMEDLTSRINELEEILQEKNLALEKLEASCEKATARLSTTLIKFDELHQLSAGLVSQVEDLQSQIQTRDEEISFLRQEVTRCTNDVLAASQESNRRNSTEMREMCTWLNMMVSHLGVHSNFDDKDFGQIQTCKEVFEKQITSVMLELEDLRVTAQSKDALLQVERNKVEELLHKRETLESSLHEKELQLALFQGARGPGETPNTTSSEIVEVEPMINKRAVAGASIPSHVRSMRKGNNDQVAIAIDMDPDALHGFKSLTTSRVVPRFTRPVSDMVDGLW
ncbi:hypothetical protein BVC80_8967g1 [Macleaya cordata]|uniref:Prefoldin n=1 Tax=Macleaya cordata TaxID=56857 RepID=A0A200PLW5_MACCD|nr:hypothetical protein BVC80_8967g1 [Macleaya cordata]